MKTQVLGLTGSVTLQGAVAEQPSLQPPQPRDKVQELRGHPLHREHAVHQRMPQSTRPRSSRHGTGLCSASQCTGTVRAEGAQSPSHPKAESAGDKQIFCWCIPQSKLSCHPPTGTLEATRSNATFHGIGGSGGLSKAHEHHSKGVQYDPLSRQTR